MAKFKWSETFLSLEGEGPLTGVPTVYARFTKCPFRCAGFNNPDNVKITNEVLGFDPADFKQLKDLPPIEIGCDTLYAIDNRFKHLWKSGTEDELAQEIVDLLPGGNWNHPVTGQPVALSLTGGEPTLYQKTIPDLLNHHLLKGCNLLIIETNATVPITDDFLMFLKQWAGFPKRKVIWSNSPKLKNSGEPREKAIKPDIILRQQTLGMMAAVGRANVIIYYKFVTDGSDESMDEIHEVLQEFWDAGIDKSHIAYLMPESCTGAQQNEIAVKVADACIEHGFVYSYRLQNAIYENAIGK